MQNKKSLIIYLVCACLLIGARFYYPKYKMPQAEATIGWDVSGYYTYLPAIFIYKDLRHLTYFDSIHAQYKPTPEIYECYNLPNENYRVAKYSMGQSFFMLPFFALAHYIVVPLMPAPADGYSYPYQFCIAWGMLLYALIALWVLRKILLHFFTDEVVAITLFIIVACSNYLNYAGIETGMTHTTVFLLYTLIIYNTIKFYKNPTAYRSALIGLLVGWAMLTRPTEIISILIPLLWGVYNVETLKQRFLFIIKNWNWVLILGICCGLVFSIQLFYWKWLSGNWFIYSYQDQGFDWLHPHHIGGLFSYRSGWLTYNPIMWLVLPGWYFLFQYKRENFAALFVWGTLYIYITYAWCIWWYGHRAMVQSYAGYSFAIAAMVLFLLKTKARKIFLFCAIAFTMLYNFWQIQQYHYGSLGMDGVNKAYFWNVFFKQNVPAETSYLLDTDRNIYKPSKEATIIYTNNFEQDSSAKLFNNSKQLFSNKIQIFSKAIIIPTQNLKTQLGISAIITATQKEYDVWKMPQLCVETYSKGTKIESRSIRTHRLLQANTPLPIYVSIRVNKDIDSVKIFLWNVNSETETWMDDVVVRSW
jgi:hypothetical protein